MLRGRRSKMKDIVYIDTNIFITLFLKRRGYKKIEKFLKGSLELNIEFVTSEWTLTEIIKVLIRECQITSAKANNYIGKLQREKRVGEAKFKFIETSLKEKYDCEEFFYHLQKIILKYQGNIADSIHALIMQNNKIKKILTADDDFEGIKDIVAINPLNF